MNADAPPGEDWAAKAERRVRAQAARDLAAAGREAGNSGDFTAAEARLRAAAELGKLSALGDWVRLLLQQERVGDAMQAFETIVQSGEDWVPALGQQLTYAALRHGLAREIDTILAGQLNGCARDIARPLLMMTRGAASRLDQHTLDLAREEIAAEQVHPKGLASAATILRRRPDQNAEAALRVALEREPNNEVALAELASLLAEQGRCTALVELAHSFPRLLDQGGPASALAIEMAPDLASAAQREQARLLLDLTRQMEAASSRSLALIRDAATIAIVGNGPAALGKGAGPMIDGRDLVIRFNAFQTSGFERDYGSRTDLVVRRPDHDPSLDPHVPPGVPILLSGQSMPWSLRDPAFARRLIDRGHPLGFFPAGPVNDLVARLEAVPTAGLTTVWMAAALRGGISRGDLFGFTLDPHAHLPLLPHYYGDAVLCTRHAYDREAELLSALADGLFRPTRWTPQPL